MPNDLQPDEELVWMMNEVCELRELPLILAALAELCDRDAEKYTRERDDSGIVQSCRTDAEDLRELAQRMHARHGG